MHTRVTQIPFEIKLIRVGSCSDKKLGGWISQSPSGPVITNLILKQDFIYKEKEMLSNTNTDAEGA